MLMKEEKRCEKRTGKRKLLKEDIVQPTTSEVEKSFSKQEVDKTWKLDTEVSFTFLYILHLFCE